MLIRFFKIFFWSICNYIILIRSLHTHGMTDLQWRCLFQGRTSGLQEFQGPFWLFYEFEFEPYFLEMFPVVLFYLVILPRSQAQCELILAISKNLVLCIYLCTFFHSYTNYVLPHLATAKKQSVIPTNRIQFFQGSIQVHCND